MPLVVHWLSVKQKYKNNGGITVNQLNLDNVETSFILSIIVADLLENRETGAIEKIGKDKVISISEYIQTNMDVENMTPDEQDEKVARLVEKLATALNID